MRPTVAVLGATGFVGRHLTQRLLELGHEVFATGTRTAPRAREGLVGRTWDAARDDLELPAATDAVVYLAQSPFYRDFANRADHVLGVNTLGAVRAARAAQRVGAKLFFYASTGNVYAPSFEPLTETADTSRASGYALSKLTAENALALLGSPMSIVCGRIFGAFGPGQTGMLVANIADRVRSGTPVTLAPRSEGVLDGGLRVSLCFIDDLVAGLVSLVDRARCNAVLPETMNVGGHEAIDLRRLATTIGSELGLEPRFEVGDTPRRGDLIADVTRWTELVSPPHTSFDHAISRTLRDTSAISA